MSERFGYDRNDDGRVSFGERVADMFDGGGRGRSGPQFEGGGVISRIGNALGGPGVIGFGGDGGGNRGARIGSTVGGMMFGPLGMLGGGLLGGMLGGGNRGGAAPTAPTPRPASPAPAGARPRPTPASALAPTSSAVPRQRPFAPTDAAIPVMPPSPSPSTMNLPPATMRFVEQYGASPDAMRQASLERMLGMTRPMPRPMAPPPMMIDRATGMPIAMSPPRIP